MNKKIVTIVFLVCYILVLLSFISIPYLSDNDTTLKVSNLDNEGYIRIMPYTSDTEYSIFQEPYTSDDYAIMK